MSLLLIVACVLLFLAAFDYHWAQFPRLQFGWLGLAFGCLSILLPAGQGGYFHAAGGLAWVLVVALVIVIIALLVRPRAT